MTSTSEPVLDLGHGVRLEFVSWRAHPRAGYIQQHPHPTEPDVTCTGSGLFDLPGIRENFPGRPVWKVDSWEPLTLSPSLLCTVCGNHGWVKEGRWVQA